MITGGDSWIWRAAAIAYAREWANVAIGYLPQEESNAQQVIKIIENEWRTAVALPWDITDEEFCISLVQQAKEKLGWLDIVVNNAWHQVYQESLQDITTQQFDETLKTNLYAMFRITKEALKHLEAWASIINTASVVSYIAPAWLVDYSMTKAAQISFTKTVAKQAIKQWIRINAIAPWPFRTPLQPSWGQPQDNIEQFGKTTPLWRPWQPVEISHAYVFLASQEASYMTGEVFWMTWWMMPF